MGSDQENREVVAPTPRVGACRRQTPWHRSPTRQELDHVKTHENHALYRQRARWTSDPDRGGAADLRRRQCLQAQLEAKLSQALRMDVRIEGRLGIGVFPTGVVTHPFC